MRQVLALLGGGLAGVLVLSAACGGGSDNSSATPSPNTATIATNAATVTPAASTGAAPSASDLSSDLATLRTAMQDTIARTQAGDEQGVMPKVAATRR